LGLNGDLSSFNILTSAGHQGGCGAADQDNQDNGCSAPDEGSDGAARKRSTFEEETRERVVEARILEEELGTAREKENQIKFSFESVSLSQKFAFEAETRGQEQDRRERQVGEMGLFAIMPGRETSAAVGKRGRRGSWKLRQRCLK
jgi:hypothetical protein